MKTKGIEMLNSFIDKEEMIKEQMLKQKNFMVKQQLDIVVDFDGTCVSHEFPKIGRDIGAVPVLKELVSNGHQLILFTMRSDRLIGGNTGDPEISDVTGTFLTDAINWFSKNDIPLYGIQKNPTQTWTTSPKAYGHLYIDDAALGCPLIYKDGERPHVDWIKIRELLIKDNIIK